MNMTKQQAIEELQKSLDFYKRLLKTIKYPEGIRIAKKSIAALDLAIEALKGGEREGKM